jgi:hypothetical protein
MDERRIPDLARMNRARPGLNSLLLTASRAGLHAFVTHLGTGGTHFVVRVLLANLGAHLACLRAGFTTDGHHGSVAAANRQAVFAEFRAVEASLDAVHVLFLALRDHLDAVGVALQAFGHALGTGRTAFTAAFLVVFHKFRIYSGNGTDASEESSGGADTGENFTAIHDQSPRENVGSKIRVV